MERNLLDDSVGRYFGISRRNEDVHICGGCNARYLLADIEYEEKDFDSALDDYTAVGPRLSDPAKAARAQYRKASCLME